MALYQTVPLAGTRLDTFQCDPIVHPLGKCHTQRRHPRVPIIPAFAALPPWELRNRRPEDLWIWHTFAHSSAGHRLKRPEWKKIQIAKRWKELHDQTSASGPSPRSTIESMNATSAMMAISRGCTSPWRHWERRPTWQRSHRSAWRHDCELSIAHLVPVPPIHIATTIGKLANHALWNFPRDYVAPRQQSKKWPHKELRS